MWFKWAFLLLFFFERKKEENLVRKLIFWSKLFTFGKAERSPNMFELLLLLLERNGLSASLDNIFVYGCGENRGHFFFIIQHTFSREFSSTRIGLVFGATWIILSSKNFAPWSTWKIISFIYILAMKNGRYNVTS